MSDPTAGSRQPPRAKPPTVSIPRVKSFGEPGSVFTESAGVNDVHEAALHEARADRRWQPGFLGAQYFGQDRIAVALERIADVLERAFPEPRKRFPPVSVPNAALADACDRFHPGEQCVPGFNHPSVANGS